MAIARATLSGGVYSGLPNKNTPNISPAPNSALLMAVRNSTGGTSPPDVTVSGLGLTWSSPVSNTTTHLRGRFWTAQCGASPGTGVVTMTWSAGVTMDIAWSIEQITGQDSAVTGVTTFNSGSGSSPTLSTGSGRDANSRLFVAVANYDGYTTTPAANFVELSDDGSGYGLETQWRPDAFQTTNTSTLAGSASEWITLAVEVLSAPPAPPVKNLATLGVG